MVFRVAVEGLVQVLAGRAERSGSAPAGVGERGTVRRAMGYPQRAVVIEQHAVLDIDIGGVGQAPGDAYGDGAGGAAGADGIDGIVGHQQATVIDGIVVPADFKLLQVVEAADRPSLALGPGELRRSCLSES